MKKFLSTIVLFLISFGLFYSVFICIVWPIVPKTAQTNLKYPYASYGHMLSRLKEVKSVDSVSILFLGSSHAYRGFDTRLFEAIDLQTFNLGSSAQTPIQTEVLLQRYLDGLAPRLVIFEVNPNSFSSDGVESALDVIANDQIDLKTISMAMKVSHLSCYNALLFRGYLSLFKTKEDFFNEAKVKGEDRYISGGYVEKQLRFNRPGKPYHFDVVYKDQQLKAFERILDQLRHRKIPYYLVQAPVTTIGYTACNDNAGFDQLMRMKGPYINYNHLLKLNDSLHFYDTHHLNQNGVKVFNQYFIDHLIRPYFKANSDSKN
ncbi:hypothetical protein NA63_1688 [Flavobacteriaceae bacterium MAR_2010_105]|nr:hypothetical protein NA63_1688 [Flavobacteriaceae bacterium MAR_2010_105]